MKKKIFKNTILIILLLVVLCGASIIGVLYNYFNKQYVTSLDQAAGYIAEGVDLAGMDFLTNLNEKEKRITWVAADGTVLYDNKADISTMENHKNRTEIKQAMTSSAGTSVRYSKTLSEETIYHAIRIGDGSVVRVSVIRKSMPALLMKVLLPVLLVLLLGVEFSAILAYRLSRQITTPLEAIDLDHPDESTVYDELSPFIRKIRLQNEEIQKAMNQLQAQKNEFAMITENMQEGFLVVDKQAIVLSHNRSISKIFDVDSSVDGKHVLEINRSEEFTECIKKAIQGIHSEYICPVKGRYYNIYANPVFRNNEVAGAVVIITDVTEKEEREDLRREFSANVSHELKTPLTSISGIAEIIKNGIVDKKDVKPFAGKIYDEARRLIHLVEDIIKLSQLDEGEQAVEMTQIDLYDLTKIELRHLEPVAEEKHVAISLEGEHVMVSGIHSVLEEMVYNLIENAIKYNKEDGTIDIAIKKEKHRCEFSVKDSGIGIPEDQLDRIFERFYRVDKSHSKAIGGTGLGLSIVKHGVTFLGGTLKMVSEIGKGTELTMTFPKERKVV